MQLPGIPCLRVHRPAARDRWTGGDGADTVSSGSIPKRTVLVLREEEGSDERAVLGRRRIRAAV